MTDKIMSPDAVSLQAQIDQLKAVLAKYQATYGAIVDDTAIKTDADPSHLQATPPITGQQVFDLMMGKAANAFDPAFNLAAGGGVYNPTGVK